MATDSSGVVWREQKALIIGRAYPEPSKKHIETVCTGAITEDGQLLRLYPISWRYLNENQQYRLWSWATFEIRKSEGDKRKRREERKAQLAARKALNAAKKAERALSPKPFDDGRLHPRFQRIKRKAEAVGSNGFDPNHVAQLLGEYADPEYYNRSADVRMASPLAGMR